MGDAYAALTKRIRNVNEIKHRAGQRCFELLALIGSPQLSFQRYSQLFFFFFVDFWKCVEFVGW